MLEEPSADRQGTEAMRSTDPSVTVIRYRRSKALAFGAMMLAIGAGIAWLAWDALDPGWTSPTDDGALLQALPYWVRAPFIVVIATIVLTPGVTMVWSGLRNAVVVRADSEGISEDNFRAAPIPGVGRYRVGEALRNGEPNHLVSHGSRYVGAGNLGPEISPIGRWYAGNTRTRRRSVIGASSSRSHNFVQAGSRRLMGRVVLHLRRVAGMRCSCSPFVIAVVPLFRYAR